LGFLHVRKAEKSILGDDMRIITAVIVFLVAVLCIGCASTTSSRPIDATTAATIKKADVMVIVPSMQTGVGGSPSSGINVVVIPLDKSIVGPSIVASAIGTGILEVIVGGEVRAQYKESELVLAKSGNILNSNYAKHVLEYQLKKLSAKAMDIPFNSLTIADGDSTAFNRQKKAEQNTSLANIFFHQSFSLDLSKLRITLRAVVNGPEGDEQMVQNFYYLPVSIAGATKDDTMQNWMAEDYKLYRQHLQDGIEALSDALNLAFFSYRSAKQGSTSSDATAWLRRTNCYGGDYNAGIPMEAYKAGSLMAVRDKYVVIKLNNNDILTFPKCEAAI
jgi:hypothetical protein